MVQFLSINFFSWNSSIFVGFFKSSRFFVSLCINSIQSWRCSLQSSAASCRKYQRFWSNIVLLFSFCRKMKILTILCQPLPLKTTCGMSVSRWKRNLVKNLERMLRNAVQAIHLLFKLRRIKMLRYQLYRFENNLFSWLQDIRKATIRQ